MALLSGGGRPLRVVPAREPEAVAEAIARRLLSDGPAVLPAADPAAETAFAQRLAEGGGLPEELALVVSTSGSTAAPKRVALSAGALRAAAEASGAELDRRVAASLSQFELTGPRGLATVQGPEAWQWVLCLPAHYIAGAQVLVRAALGGGRAVVAATERFRPRALVDAYEELDAPCLAVSLVPAQLQRLLAAAEASPRQAERYGVEAEELREVMAAFDAILVGGQALPRSVRERAERLDWQLIATYGASETAGGCVYDGAPLPGVELRVEDGELLVAAPQLASGYAGDPERSAAAFPEIDGRRWYRTGDAGLLEPDPTVPGGTRLRVTGRLDDVIVSGGEKVPLGGLEARLRELRGFEELVVAPCPSEQWGRVPVAVLASPAVEAGGAVPAGPDDPALLRLRQAAGELGRAFRPAALLRVRELPRLPGGKPDRVAIAALAARVFAAAK